MLRHKDGDERVASDSCSCKWLLDCFLLHSSPHSLASLLTLSESALLSCLQRAFVLRQ